LNGKPLKRKGSDDADADADANANADADDDVEVDVDNGDEGHIGKHDALAKWLPRFRYILLGFAIFC